LWNNQVSSLIAPERDPSGSLSFLLKKLRASLSLYPVTCLLHRCEPLCRGFLWAEAVSANLIKADMIESLTSTIKNLKRLSQNDASSF
jgi:hypothetical protein